MVEENGDDALKPEDGPTCPKCGANLTEYRGHMIAMPAGVANLVWCANPECRVLLSFQIIGPPPQPQRSAPRILRPGMLPPINPTRKM